jgi:uncharacterized protein
MIKEIEEKAKEYLKDAGGVHDWEHVKRVYNLCLHLGKKENANLEILKLSALLHDIARPIEDESKGEKDHAIIGAKMATDILRDSGYNEDLISQVAHCIETHRFRNGHNPKTKEAMILFDADKLDSVGAVGIGRAFLFSGKINAKLHDKDIDVEKAEAYSKDDTAYREFLVKLSKIKDKMLTTEGKRISEERHEFMVEFFDRMNKEVDGIL